jgi:outer membrane protein, heavy metal efflux system
VLLHAAGPIESERAALFTFAEVFMISPTFDARSLFTAGLVLLITSTIQNSAAETVRSETRKTLSSSKLVAEVLARNPTLPAMQAAWEAEQAHIEQVSALDDPTLAYMIAPATIGDPRTDFGQKLELSQKIPWPGTLRLRGEAARYEADAAREEITNVRLKLINAATTLAGRWYFVHAAIRINEVNRKLLEEFREIAVHRYSTGLASQQDALRADVEVNLLKHRSILLDRQRREIAARIDTLLNRPPDYPLPPPASLSEPPPQPDVEILREQARDTRPELKVLLARTQAFKAQAGLAERSRFPDLTIRAGYNTLWDRDSKRFAIGVGVNLPLDQGKRRAAEDEAQARIKQSEWALLDQAARVDEEVQIAYDRLQESRHTVTLYRDSLLPLAEQELAAALSDYRTGIGDFLDLISSEKSVMQTQLQSVRALADLHIRLGELNRAVGLLEPESGKDIFRGEEQ